jgi:hypothetical protein
MGCITLFLLFIICAAPANRYVRQNVYLKKEPIAFLTMDISPFSMHVVEMLARPNVGVILGMVGAFSFH